MERVKTAVVGCGMISNIYIRNLKNMFSIIDLVAVCDIHAEAAREKAELYGVAQVMTIDEVAASEEIELVVNLTAPMAHYDVMKKMLLAGKHVYTEKMFTTELSQAEELVKIAEEKKLLIAVAPDTVLGAGVQTAKYVLDKGLIGTPTSCLISMNRNQSLNSEVFRFLQKQGGALPDDVGIYFIAAALTLLGPVTQVHAVGAPALEHPGRFPETMYWPEAWYFGMVQWEVFILTEIPLVRRNLSSGSMVQKESWIWETRKDLEGL